MDKIPTFKRVHQIGNYTQNDAKNAEYSEINSKKECVIVFSF